MMRVLQMIGTLGVGGAQTMIMNIYRHIDRSEMQFDFVLSHTGPGHEYFVDEVRSMGGEIYTTPTFNGLNAAGIRRWWDEFFAAHPEYKVMHIHLTSYASIYIPVARKHGVKVIVHSHNTSSGSGAMGAFKDFMQLPLRRQADVMIACSAEAGEWLFGRDVRGKDNYYFLPNAIDLEKFRPDDAARDRYRREMGLEDTLVIGHVGRFSQQKNHPFLIELFAKLHEKRADSHLLLVGDGERMEQIRQLVEKLGLTDAVTMTGNRDDVPELLQTMDIIAFPSLWEGLPVTLVEAQAAGLPCVIADNISSDVDITPLVTRLPIDDPEIWAEELSKEHPRQDVTEDIIRSGFDIKSSVEKISKLYLTLAGEKKNA